MSDYTKIVNYAAKDALVEGDPNKIIKGTELDAEFVAIQTAVGTKSNLNSPTFTGVPRGPTASVGTNTTQLATTAFVQQNSVPIGGIIMWSGATATIPQGYKLCDGSNGTPDLRGKFIIGAGGSYNPAATGGSAAVTLITANLPAHNHIVTIDSGGTHSHSATDSGHYHNETSVATGGTGIAAGAGDSLVNNSTSTASANITVGSGGAHTHTNTVSNTGSGTAFSILPPYFALAYIMRTA